MNYRAPSLEALQAECDAFNFDCPVGGRVAVKLDGKDKPFITTTRSTAQVLSGHSAVVWMDGVSGCYDLSRVTPIPPEPVEGDAWAVLAASGNVIYWERDRAKVAQVAATHGRPFGPYKPAPRDLVLATLHDLIEAIKFTPLGVRSLKALKMAQAVMNAATHRQQ